MPKKFLVPKLIKVIAVLAVFLLLVFFNVWGVFSPVRQIFLEIAYPFQRIFYLSSAKTSSTLSFLGSIADLKNQNEKLIAQNQALSSQVADLQDQKNENATLRQQLQLAPRDKYNLEAALVVSQDPHGLGSWLMIGKGSSSGLKAGMPVIVSNGILIGKISQVYANSAKVILLTDSLSSVNVADSQTGAKGILAGEYSLGLLMGMVEQSDVLNSGDDIITSGLGGVLPRGFLIGKVQQVSSTPDKLFQQAVVIPEVKYSNLEMVFVVKGNS